MNIQVIPPKQHNLTMTTQIAKDAKVRHYAAGAKPKLHLHPLAAFYGNDIEVDKLGAKSVKNLYIISQTTAKMFRKSFWDFWNIANITMVILIVLLILAFFKPVRRCCSLCKQRKQNMPANKPRQLVAQPKQASIDFSFRCSSSPNGLPSGNSTFYI